MEIDLTTPALLFSAISLIMLAYTNRFLSYAGLVRALKEQHQKSHSSVTAAQIANLRQRLYLTRASLLLCVVSMFFIYIRLHLVSVYIFGLALVLLIISLAISVYEIYISVKALEIHLNDMGD